MRADGPPLMFVAIWGIFAVLALYGQQQMIDHGVKIAMPYQIEDVQGPIQIAGLD